MTKKNTAAADASFDEIDWDGATRVVDAVVMQEGETITGFYLGSTLVIMPDGPAHAHYFKHPQSGEAACIGTTILDQHLGRAPLGRMVRAKCTGKRAANTKGRKIMGWDVDIHPSLQGPDSDNIGRASFD